MKTLTIIVPMYNEAKRIGICIRALRSYKPPFGVEIDRVIFVSDGSTDKTLEVLGKSTLPYPRTILSYKKNRGRGYAIRTAMAAATGDYALWLDVDMSTPLSQIKKFLPYIKRGVSVIIGSRKIKGADVTVRQPLYRIILGQAFSKMSELFLNVPVGDFTCGFKAFSREAYQTIFPMTRINGWGNDSESLFLAKKHGFNIVELPVHWENDPNTKVKVLRDIYRSLVDLVQIRYNSCIGRYNLYPQLPIWTRIRLLLTYEKA